MTAFFQALWSVGLRLCGKAKLDTQLQGTPPIVLTIPPATLDQLRARRSRRKRAQAVASDRPVLTIVELAKRAGELDPDHAAKAYCDDMDRLQAEVEDKYDAFLLDPGMGPMIYITSDGRILSDSRTWDGEGIRFETSLDGVIPALVVGAKKTGVISLLDLIPPLENGVRCSTCQGTRWFRLQNSEIVCPICHGRGECHPYMMDGCGDWTALPRAAADPAGRVSLGLTFPPRLTD